MAETMEQLQALRAYVTQTKVDAEFAYIDHQLADIISKFERASVIDSMTKAFKIFRDKNSANDNDVIPRKRAKVENVRAESQKAVVEESLTQSVLDSLRSHESSKTTKVNGDRVAVQAAQSMFNEDDDYISDEPSCSVLQSSLLAEHNSESEDDADKDDPQWEDSNKIHSDIIDIRDDDDDDADEYIRDEFVDSLQIAANSKTEIASKMKSYCAGALVQGKTLYRDGIACPYVNTAVKCKTICDNMIAINRHLCSKYHEIDFLRQRSPLPPITLKFSDPSQRNLTQWLRFSKNEKQCWTNCVGFK